MEHLDNSVLAAGVMGNEALPEDVEQEVDQQNENVQKFLPAAEIVLDLIRKEREKIVNLNDVIAAFGPKGPDDNKVMVELRARHLHLDFVASIENKLQDALEELKNVRTPKK